MADNEKDGIKPSVILMGAAGVLVLFVLAMLASSYLDSGPKPAERISMGEVTPAAAPPEAPELADRVRTFFMKGNVEECMDRHLGKESRVDGLLDLELLSDGTVKNSEIKTEPQTAGVALCVQQRFARGFTFSGPAQKVSYTFNARWEGGRLVLGQNVSSSPK